MIDNNSSINDDQNDANDLLRGLSSESCLNDEEGDETCSSQEIQDEVESRKGDGDDQSKDASKGKKNNKKDKREFMAYKYSNKKKRILHEAVILTGKPELITMMQRRIKLSMRT